MTPLEKDRIIDILTKEVFPQYQKSLQESQKLIAEELITMNLPPEQFINGLIGGMSYASFELASKLSLALIFSLIEMLEKDPDTSFEEKLSNFDFTNFLN